MTVLVTKALQKLDLRPIEWEIGNRGKRVHRGEQEKTARRGNRYSKRNRRNRGKGETDGTGGTDRQTEGAREKTGKTWRLEEQGTGDGYDETGSGE